MSLSNLVGKTLETIEPDATAISRLLNAADRSLADAHVKNLSTENRFDTAYKAITQSANAALQANGYRLLTSVPGHHMTLIQSLTQTIDLDRETMIVLNAFRKQRNATDYSGKSVPESALNDCLEYAENLLHDVRHWIEKHRPELIKEG